MTNDMTDKEFREELRRVTVSKHMSNEIIAELANLTHKELLKGACGICMRTSEEAEGELKVDLCTVVYMLIEVLSRPPETL